MVQNLQDLNTRLNSLTERMAQFSSPLESMGIPFFAYARVYRNNSFLYLCNNPAWYKLKYEHQLCEFNGFVCANERRANCFSKCLFTGQPDENIRILPYLHAFGYWNSIDYYFDRQDSIEVTHFGGKVDEPQTIHHYLNHSEIFESFIYRFRHHFADLIEPPDSALLAPLTDHFREPIYELPKFPSLCSKLPLTVQEKTYLLSFRQVQCLACLLRGKTAKRTAQALHLSYRTVEFYFTLLKEKFECSNLEDILSVLSTQQITYLLSHAESYMNLILRG